MALPLLDEEAEAALAAALSFVDAYADPGDLRELLSIHAPFAEVVRRPSVGGADAPAPDRSPSSSRSDSSDEPRAMRARELVVHTDVSRAAEDLAAETGDSSGGSRGEADSGLRRRSGAKNHRNGAREQRLRELRRLRARAEELEQQLQALQISHSNRQRRRDVHVRGDGGGGGGGGGRVPPNRVGLRGPGVPGEAAAVWRELAKRQLEQRLASEGENRRLSAMLERQQKITRALEKVLQSRAAKETMDACAAGKRSRRVHSIPASRSDPEVFQRLLEQIELAYAEVDQVPRQQQQQQQQHNGSDGTFMGIFADKTLPFAVADTGAAVWKLLAHNAEQEEYRYYFQKDSPTHGATAEDIVVERFGVELHSESMSGDFTIRQVFRRYVEPERVVVVWRSLIDPVEFKRVPLAGVRFSEKGYIVVKRAAALPAFSLLQTWYVVTPETAADAFPELTEFVLNGSATARAVQVIENILLRQSMHGSA